MLKRVAGLSAVVLLAVPFAYWRWTRITPPVSEAEARAYLDRIVAAARVRDFDTLCALNLSVNQCLHVLDDFGLRGSVPEGPPVVVSTRYEPERDGFGAGRVLVVEGATPCGSRYRSEVMVLRENRYHFKAVNAVYWSNARIVDHGTTSPAGSPPPTC